uniref:Uncharacterized protein n=1 Tax=Oryza rufipogon TaxID=4529 RepID=A0A0E0QBK9_ORYRU
MKNTSEMHKLTRQSAKVAAGVPLHAKSLPAAGSLSMQGRCQGPSLREVAAGRRVPLRAEVAAPIPLRAEVAAGGRPTERATLLTGWERRAEGEGEGGGSEEEARGEGAGGEEGAVEERRLEKCASG